MNTIAEDLSIKDIKQEGNGDAFQTGAWTIEAGLDVNKPAFLKAFPKVFLYQPIAIPIKTQ